jgi:hypothetical protein
MPRQDQELPKTAILFVYVITTRGLENSYLTSVTVEGEFLSRKGI